MKKYILFLVVLAAVLSAELAMAMSAVDIMQKSVYIYPGMDQKSRLTFIIRKSDKEERKVVLKRFWKRSANYKSKEPISKVLVFNEYPPDLKDSAFMVWSYDQGKKDEQWLYIPILRKVEKVPDPVDEFFGESSIRPSEMAPRDPSLDNHAMLREEKIENKDYYVVQTDMVKKNDDYNYNKIITWITKDNFLSEKKEYYFQDKLIKTMMVTWKPIGKAWVWEKVVVNDKETSTQMIISVNDVEVDTGLTDSIFSPDTMKQGVGSIK